MKQSAIKEMTNLELMTGWYWVGVRTANQANSRRGVTKETEKIEKWYMDEICKRFDIDREELEKEINP